MPIPDRVDFVSWHTAQRLTRRLAGGIRAAHFQPDMVVAIARGGYVPARLLCDLLGIYDLASLRISHYHAGATRALEARIVSPLGVDIRGRKVLLVDDVSDTGDTLHLALDHLHASQPAEVKVAVLHHKTVASLSPDFYAQRIVRWRWITYPWAAVEDVCGFIAALDLSIAPSDTDTLLAVFQTTHGLRIPRHVIVDAQTLTAQAQLTPK